jgi:hypothetical protein
MATLVPLNTFKTVTSPLFANVGILYTAPDETATIVLMAQVTNIRDDEVYPDSNVTFSHLSNTGTISTELVKNFPVPVRDAVSVLTGRLVLEANSSITARATSNANLKITLSLLETSLI